MSTALHRKYCPSQAHTCPRVKLKGGGWIFKIWILTADLQLVPGRDNIGDVGLQTFKQVLLNKLQLNITKFTNFRPKMEAFSLKTFRLLKQRNKSMMNNIMICYIIHKEHFLIKLHIGSQQAKSGGNGKLLHIVG